MEKQWKKWLKRPKVGSNYTKKRCNSNEIRYLCLPPKSGQTAQKRAAQRHKNIGKKPKIAKSGIYEFTPYSARLNPSAIYSAFIYKLSKKLPYMPGYSIIYFRVTNNKTAKYSRQKWQTGKSGKKRSNSLIYLGIRG